MSFGTKENMVAIKLMNGTDALKKCTLEEYSAVKIT
jgi:hypothetical protein